MRKLKISSGNVTCGWPLPAPCCSPIDLSVETRLDAEVKSWFAFALQKCEELALLRCAEQR
jgi:hypothetical protein